MNARRIRRRDHSRSGGESKQSPLGERVRRRFPRMRLEWLEDRELLAMGGAAIDGIGIGLDSLEVTVNSAPELADRHVIDGHSVGIDRGLTGITVATNDSSDEVTPGTVAEATTEAAPIADGDQPREEANQYEPNQPTGEAKGLHPGRVTWIHNPEATSWDGTSGYWWEDNNTNQAVVEEMMSDAIRWQAGEQTDAAAWDAIFRHFNRTRSGQDASHRPGEKIAIKVNLNNSLRPSDPLDNKLDASPQFVLALVRQLIGQAGVDPGDIVIYDASRFMPDMIYDPIHTEFPGLLFVDFYGLNGRIPVQADTTPENQLYLSGAGREVLQLPTHVTEAKYVINAGILKFHTTTGVSATAKNHFGSVKVRYFSPEPLHPYVNANNPMESYNPLVDLVGHKHLGGKTLLYMIDGLYSADGCCTGPRRWSTFGNDWPSSIFLSQDPVAIDSVALDFLRTERSNIKSGSENYLHEAALADDPPSATAYDPENDGTPLTSLGVHEHWDNATDRQYSRNLGTGEGIELISEKPFIPPRVLGRYVFYNNSAFDGNDPAADARDDDAIAPDKSALLPGETATWANYTSYRRGINAIVIDVAGLPDTIAPDAGDFEFRVGNDNNPSRWDAAPAPGGVTLRRSEGVDGSDRVTILWSDNAIQQEWLQVTALAARLGLVTDDVFYFGNATGESGNSAGDAKVNAFDMLGARDNQRTFVHPAPIESPYDYDRDARVNAGDMLIARSHATHFLNALQLITAPARKQEAGEDGARGGSVAAYDAALEQAAAREVGPQGSSAGKLDWLYEFDLSGTNERPPGFPADVVRATVLLVATVGDSSAVHSHVAANNSSTALRTEWW